MPSQLFMCTVAAGKRLIAKGLAQDPRVRAAIEGHKLVVLAGTTNGYLMEELCPGFDKRLFFRGVTVAPGAKLPVKERAFDCVLTRDGLDTSRDIFSVLPELAPGDVLVKGANAVYLPERQAGVLIGSDNGGTIAACTTAVMGKRVELILPVGVEKRVDEPIDRLVQRVNAADGAGPRLWSAAGRAYTELDAIEALTGAKAFLAAAGGICGAEGASWILCEGAAEQIAACVKLMGSVAAEPAFAF